MDYKGGSKFKGDAACQHNQPPPFFSGIYILISTQWNSLYIPAICRSHARDARVCRISTCTKLPLTTRVIFSQVKGVLNCIIHPSPIIKIQKILKYNFLFQFLSKKYFLILIWIFKQFKINNSLIDILISHCAVYVNNICEYIHREIMMELRAQV